MYDFMIMLLCIFPKFSCVYAYVTGFDKTQLTYMYKN